MKNLVPNGSLVEISIIQTYINLYIYIIHDDSKYVRVIVILDLQNENIEIGNVLMYRIGGLIL